MPDLTEIELTNFCNANCMTCPRSHVPNKGYMAMDTLDKIIERLEEAGIKKVKYCGIGEPTLNPNFRKFTEKLKERFELFLNTNGINLTPSFIDKYISDLDKIIFSIPSLKKEEYEKLMGVNCFERINRNLDYLIENSQDTQIVLYVVLNKINLDSKDEFKKYEDYDNVEVLLSGTCNRAIPDFAKEIIDPRINDKYNCYETPTQEGYCKYSLNQIVIDWKGDYLFCASDIYKNHILGNVEDDKIEGIHKKKVDIFEKEKTPDLCKKCNTYRE